MQRSEQLFEYFEKWREHRGVRRFRTEQRESDLGRKKENGGRVSLILGIFVRRSHENIKSWKRCD